MTVIVISDHCVIPLVRLEPNSSTLECYCVSVRLEQNPSALELYSVSRLEQNSSVLLCQLDWNRTPVCLVTVCCVCVSQSALFRSAARTVVQLEQNPSVLVPKTVTPHIIPPPHLSHIPIHPSAFHPISHSLYIDTFLFPSFSLIPIPRVKAPLFSFVLSKWLRTLLLLFHYSLISFPSHTPPFHYFHFSGYHPPYNQFRLCHWRLNSLPSVVA